MNQLRMRAFSGSTNAYQAADRDTQYNGFKLDNSNRYGNARIVEMSPEEYIRRVAFGLKGGSLDSILNNASPAAVERYMRQMVRGTKFNAPTLNFGTGSSSGDERALAALMNGYKRIPVLVIE